MVNALAEIRRGVIAEEGREQRSEAEVEALVDLKNEAGDRGVGLRCRVGDGNVVVRDERRGSQSGVDRQIELRHVRAERAGIDDLRRPAAVGHRMRRSERRVAVTRGDHVDPAHVPR